MFALIRTIENLVAKVFSEFGGLLTSISEGINAGVKKGGTVVTAVAVLGIAASAASEIAPAAKHVLRSDWLGKVGEIVTKGLSDLK